ncbi:hypothetical protein DTL42_20735 [Bremerella cremea]|uniref:Outer membrane lipoprotein-sorting protein n=1 Tax=Bremerella cremea TaxID=1031537 RepID=A0A368KJT5_9BACT|nr:hypothetical protein [Bremerella cremea]RCS41019.1 hypothetical protein DTL42_20735 [Bremerella cremea]
MFRNQIVVVVGCTLLGLILLPSAWAEEIDAKEALKKMSETRDRLVSGRCSIAGFSEALERTRITKGSISEDRLELVFDDRIPAYFLEDGLKSAFLETSEHQYSARDGRSFIVLNPTDLHVSERGVVPFNVQTLGFSLGPASRLQQWMSNHALLKEAFANSEVLESEKGETLWRIKVLLPKQEENHYAVTMQLWLDPSRDYVTTRIEQLGADRTRLVARSEMLWAKVNDVWVITNFREFRSQSHSPFMNWKLTWTDVNEAIPESEFDLENLPNPGRSASIQAGYQRFRGWGSLPTIHSNAPKPEGDPDWSSLPPVE